MTKEYGITDQKCLSFIGCKIKKKIVWEITEQELELLCEIKLFKKGILLICFVFSIKNDEFKGHDGEFEKLKLYEKLKILNLFSFKTMISL